MKDCPKSLRIPDDKSRYYVLRCKKAMYGFTDAPLMFQLALISFLLEQTGGVKSILDDNFIFWHFSLEECAWNITCDNTPFLNCINKAGYHQGIYGYRWQ